MKDDSAYEDSECWNCFGTGEGGVTEWHCPICSGKGYIRTFYEDDNDVDDPLLDSLD